jgi:cell division protein FtsI (penicillin-binding protein 3)
VGVLVLALFALLLGKLAWLQTVEAPRLRAISERQRFRPVPESLAPVGLRVPLVERAPRGEILDRTGRTLAKSHFEHRLYFDPVAWERGVAGCAFEDFVEELPRLLRAEGVQVDARQVGRKLRQRRTADGRAVREVLLARDVSPGARRRLAETFKDACWSGLYFRDLVARKYPWGEATSQVVGVVGEAEDDADGAVAGRCGLEWQLDALLAGRRGVRGGERDSTGRELDFGAGFVLPPLEGATVTLTIDAEISRICLEALARNAKDHPCRRSSAVVIAPRTGEILAAVSYPSSPPEGPGLDARRLALAAVSDSYEPGSTIKPVVIGWALEKNRIRGDEAFECGGPDGSEVFHGRVVTEYSVNPEPLTPAQILWRSSNVGATRIGLERLRLPGLFEAFRTFRVASRPQSGLPNEAAGYHTPQKADSGRGLPGATDGGAGVSFPRGYEIRLSPLALAVAYTPFATGGFRVEPTVVKSVRVGDRTIEPPRPRTRVLSERACGYVCDAMLEAFENPRGTAHGSARSARYSIMGKTGTSQYADRQVARGQQYNAWIVGIAPARADDAAGRPQDPEIVVVVVHHRVANRGKGTYTGGVVSGPAAREIVERTLDHLGIAPDQPHPVEEGGGG